MSLDLHQGSNEFIMYIVRVDIRKSSSLKITKSGEFNEACSHKWIGTDRKIGTA